MRHVTRGPVTAQRAGDGSGDPRALSQPVLTILLSLADRPRHGYALIKDIAELSGGRVRLTTGTLYGALRRLLESGWIEPFDQDDTSREKQAYRLTAAGRQRLQREIDGMKGLVRAAASRLRKRHA